MLPTRVKLVTAILLASSIAGILVRMAPAEPPGQAAKARWEYRALKRVDIEKMAPKPAEPKTGPAIYKGQSAENLGQGLSVLGDEGWELVAIEPYRHESYRDAGTGSQVNMYYSVIYVFKRPR